MLQFLPESTSPEEIKSTFSLPCKLQKEIWIACSVREFVLVKVGRHVFQQPKTPTGGLASVKNNRFSCLLTPKTVYLQICTRVANLNTENGLTSDLK